MTTITAAEAQSRLSELLDQVAGTHEPVLITREGGDAILVAEEDWRAIQETLHLCSTPGMRESILEGMDTPVCDCTEDLDW